MSDSSEQIHNWQEKVRQSFGDQSRLLDYMFKTLENFFYRYLETDESKNLKVTELAPHVFGAISFESSMVNALKVKHPEAKAGIMELAKRVPKAQKPLVKYELSVAVKELTPDKGYLILKAAIDWDFPDFSDKSKVVKKEAIFKYDDLSQFRKELAIRLEEVSELFL